MSRTLDEALDVPLLKRRQAVQGSRPLSVVLYVVEKLLVLGEVEHQDLVPGWQRELVVEKRINHQQIPRDRFLGRTGRQFREIEGRTRSKQH